MTSTTFTFPLPSGRDAGRAVRSIVRAESELSLLHAMLTGKRTLVRLADGTACAVRAAELAGGGWSATAEPTEDPEARELLDRAAEREAERQAERAAELKALVATEPTEARPA